MLAGHRPTCPGIPACPLTWPAPKRRAQVQSSGLHSGRLRGGPPPMTAQTTTDGRPSPPASCASPPALATSLRSRRSSHPRQPLRRVCQAASSKRSSPSASFWRRICWTPLRGRRSHAPRMPGLACHHGRRAGDKQPAGGPSGCVFSSCPVWTRLSHCPAAVLWKEQGLLDKLMHQRSCFTCCRPHAGQLAVGLAVQKPDTLDFNCIAARHTDKIDGLLDRRVAQPRPGLAGTAVLTSVPKAACSIGVLAYSTRAMPACAAYSFATDV